MVITALQSLRLKVHPEAVEAVKSVFLNTFGDNLTKLKTLIDSKESYDDCNKLFFVDLTEEQRADIFEHFETEAENMIKENKHKIRRKILSDIDDTLYSSGGSYAAGVDKRYPKRVSYPGATTFYRELDILWKKGGDKLGNLVFLSARPHVYKDFSEAISFKKFKGLREKSLLHCRPGLLSGEWYSGTKFLAGDLKPLGERKFENFYNYVKIYPEFRFVFIGDNGQSDYYCSKISHTKP
eukprot:UN33482